MPTNADQHTLEWMVKFPGISPEDGESIDDYDDYFKVLSCNEAGKQPSSLGPQFAGWGSPAAPQVINIQVSPSLANRLEALTEGELSKEIICIRLKMNENKPFKELEQKLTGCTLAVVNQMVVIGWYDKLKKETKKPGGTTTKFGWSFVDNKEI